MMGLDDVRKLEIMKSLALGLTRFHPQQPDTNTEFPTSDAVRFQALLRGEQTGLHLQSSGQQADIIAQIMWSWQRKSREREFVPALVGISHYDDQNRLRYGALGDWRQYLPENQKSEKDE